MRQKLRRISRLANVPLALVCFSLTILPAQDDGPVKITSEVRVVEVDVTVRDAQGKPVEGLLQKDFTILDNGKPRPFTIFNANGGAPAAKDPGNAQPAPSAGSTPQPPLPPNTFTNARVTAPPADGHSTILLLDGVNAWFDSFAYGVQAVEGLMDKVPPDEKIAVYVVAKNLGLIVLQDYTTDRQLLKKKVASFIPRHMAPAPPGKGKGDVAGGLISSAGASPPPRPAASGPNPRAAPPDLNPLQIPAQVREFDALRATEDLRMSLKALATKLRKLPGRKSVFWITEGFPPALLRNMSDAWDHTIAALNDANIQVNTVDACDNGRCKSRLWGPSGGLGQQEIAQRTGGTAYMGVNGLDAEMAAGIADSRSSYTLGFYLTEIDGKYHELKVRVDRPGVQVNQRQGYYAQTEAVAELAGKKVDLEASLLSPVDSTEVGITAGFDIASASPRNILNAKLKLDPESLSMVKKGEGWAGQIEEMFVEFDEAGNEVGRQSDKKHFEITAAQKPKFDAMGMTLPQTIPMAAGAVKLRIIVRDTASGRTGSLTVPLAEVSTPHIR